MTEMLAGAATAVAIRSAVPTFLVPDVGATARWYVEELGFVMGGTVPRLAVDAHLANGAEIMLLSLDGYRKPDLTALRPAGLWDAYLRTDGVRALYESLDAKPFIKMPLTQQPYGDWEFEVHDPNGYVLVFGGGE